MILALFLKRVLYQAEFTSLLHVLKLLRLICEPHNLLKVDWLENLITSELKIFKLLSVTLLDECVEIVKIQRSIDTAFSYSIWQVLKQTINLFLIETWHFSLIVERELEVAQFFVLWKLRIHELVQDFCFIDMRFMRIFITVFVVDYNQLLQA